MRAIWLRLSLCRHLLAVAALVAVLGLPVAAHAQVVVVANGSPITEFDIAQRTKLIAVSTHKKPTRQEVINELIDERLKIAKASVYGLHVTAEQVNTAFASMAKRQGSTVKQFEQALARAGIAPEAVKARIKAQITWSQLVRGKFGPSLQISDADINRAMEERHETDAAEIGYIYTLYPVTVVVPPGSSEVVMRAKRHEAENLRARFTSCKQGLALARALRDVAVREPISRASASLPKATRDVLASLPIGHLTTPDVTSLGLQMFALCDKKQTSQESPLKNQVRAQIFERRFKRVADRYMQEIRKSAMIEYQNQ